MKKTEFTPLRADCIESNVEFSKTASAPWDTRGLSLDGSRAPKRRVKLLEDKRSLAKARPVRLVPPVMSTTGFDMLHSG